MFILRIGAEALKISDDSLSKNLRHSTISKFKSPRTSVSKQKYSTDNSSILYNLLTQTSTGTSHNYQSQLSPFSKPFVDRANSSDTELVKPSTLRSAASRPSSAPQYLRFHPYVRVRSVPYTRALNDKSTVISFHPEILILQWLKNMVLIVKPDCSGENSLWKVLKLLDLDRRRILKRSWHLVFITYLVEFIQTNDWKIKSILGLLIKDYEKTFDNGNYKKLFRLTRVFIVDLETVIGQMIDLKFSSSLFQIFRVAILFTDRQEDKALSNMELLKPLLLCHSKEYYHRFNEVVDNLFRLDVIMAESMFCGHLTQSVDNIIDELYTKG